MAEKYGEGKFITFLMCLYYFVKVNTVLQFVAFQVKLWLFKQNCGFSSKIVAFQTKLWLFK